MPSAEPHIILIDGLSGVGKTTLATTMAESLGAVVIHLDDVYPGWEGLEEGRDAVIESVLVPFVSGGEPRLTRWDWSAQRPGDVVSIPHHPILVVEGCGISTARSRALAHTTVWMTCAEEVRVNRRFARDGLRFDEFNEVWDRQVAAHITANDPISTATVVVNG